MCADNGERGGGGGNAVVREVAGDSLEEARLAVPDHLQVQLASPHLTCTLHTHEGGAAHLPSSLDRRRCRPGFRQAGLGEQAPTPPLTPYSDAESINSENSIV